MAAKSSFPVKGALITAALGLVGYKALSVLDTAANVSMEFAGVSFKGFSDWKLRLGINLRFLNPSRNDVALEYILANVKLGNDLVGAITDSGFKKLRESNPNAFVLKAQNATTLPITISMPISGAIANVLLVLIGQKTTREVSVNGFWKSEGFPKQPFNIKDQLSFS